MFNYVNNIDPIIIMIIINIAKIVVIIQDYYYIQNY